MHQMKNAFVSKEELKRLEKRRHRKRKKKIRNTDKQPELAKKKAKIAAASPVKHASPPASLDPSILQHYTTLGVNDEVSSFTAEIKDPYHTHEDLSSFVAPWNGDEEDEETYFPLSVQEQLHEMYLDDLRAKMLI